jgi:hypothetical protein
MLWNVEHNIKKKEEFDKKEFLYGRKMIHMKKISDTSLKIPQINFSNFPNHITIRGIVEAELNYGIQKQSADK